MSDHFSNMVERAQGIAPSLRPLHPVYRLAAVDVVPPVAGDSAVESDVSANISQTQRVGVQDAAERRHITPSIVQRSADTRSADTRSADTRSADTRSADTRSADTRSADTRSADTRSAETRSAEIASDALANRAPRDAAALLNEVSVVGQFESQVRASSEKSANFGVDRPTTEVFVLLDHPEDSAEFGRAQIGQLGVSTNSMSILTSQSEQTSRTRPPQIASAQPSPDQSAAQRREVVSADETLTITSVDRPQAIRLPTAARVEDLPLTRTRSSPAPLEWDQTVRAGVMTPVPPTEHTIPTAANSAPERRNEIPARRNSFEFGSTEPSVIEHEERHVTVSIGRLEVRVIPTSSPKLAAPPSRNASALNEYLRERQGGGR
jgi:hypothetical protein